MVFEGAREDFEEFEGMTAEEAETRLHEYENIMEREDIKDNQGKRDGPCFFVQRIPHGCMATQDFNNNRIRIWTNEDGGIMSIGVG